MLNDVVPLGRVDGARNWWRELACVDLAAMQLVAFHSSMFPIPFLRHRCEFGFVGGKTLEIGALPCKIAGSPEGG